MRNFVYAAVVFGSGQRFSKVNYSGPKLGSLDFQIKQTCI